MAHNTTITSGESMLLYDDPAKVKVNYFGTEGKPPIHLCLSCSGVQLIAHLTPEQSEEIAEQLDEAATTARKAEKFLNNDE